jgi:hypothetical protein
MGVHLRKVYGCDGAWKQPVRAGIQTLVLQSSIFLSFTDLSNFRHNAIFQKVKQRNNSVFAVWADVFLVVMEAR